MDKRIKRIPSIHFDWKQKRTKKKNIKSRRWRIVVVDMFKSTWSCEFGPFYPEDMVLVFHPDGSYNVQTIPSWRPKIRTMPPLTVPLSDISTGKSPEKIVTWNISSRHWKNSSKDWIAVVTVNRKLWARACISRRHNCSFPSKWKFWYQNFSILKSQHWKPVANNSSM